MPFDCVVHFFHFCSRCHHTAHRMLQFWHSFVVVVHFIQIPFPPEHKFITVRFFVVLHKQRKKRKKQKLGNTKQQTTTNQHSRLVLLWTYLQGVLQFLVQHVQFTHQQISCSFTFRSTGKFLSFCWILLKSMNAFETERKKEIL